MMAKIQVSHMEEIEVEAVVFDMDGIIFDSEVLVIETWKAVAERYGIPGIELACRDCLGLNSAMSREVFRKHYGDDFPYEYYKKQMSALFHERAAGGKLPQKPGVKELLQYLRKKGVKTAVASSTRREIVCRELEEGGLISFFDQIVCGDMVERSKPEPDIFLKACELIHVLPEKAFAIEDSYNGIRSAHTAGMRAIMVPDLMEPNEEMRELSECILPSLTEVKRYLEEIEAFA